MFKSLITKQVVGNRKGFTILELVVVLLILSILSGFLYSKFTGREQAAKIAATYSTILRHFEAAKSYTANHGTDGDYTNATTGESGSRRSYQCRSDEPVEQCVYYRYDYHDVSECRQQ